MPASKRPTSVIARPAALLVVESEAVLRDALAPAADALKQGLISQGYDVVVSSPDEARHLLKLRSFDKIYGDRTFLLNQDPDRQAASSGPKVEDLGNGTARVQMDQVLPWSAVFELLGIVADTTPNDLKRFS